MELHTLYRLLFRHYGPQHWWPAESPYEMMVGAILTQNTAWANVKKTIANFGEKLTPAFVTEISDGELEEIIRPSGFFRQKAARLKTLTGWYARYRYDIETARAQGTDTLRMELLALKGVGRETADSILLYALQKPVFVIDAYTRRVFARLGFAVPSEYEVFRRFFEENLPRDPALYNEYHALIVRHATTVCRKRPDCADCPFAPSCPGARNDD